MRRRHSIVLCAASLASTACAGFYLGPVPHPQGAAIPRAIRSEVLCLSERELDDPLLRAASATSGVEYAVWRRQVPSIDHIDGLARLDGVLRWTRDVEHTDLMAVAPGGDALLVQWNGRLTRVSAADGHTVWSTDYWATHHCGMTRALAVAPDGSALLACGYSLLRFTPGGAVAWQRWPLGNADVSALLVDSAYVAYVAADGRVAAVDGAGEVLWRADAGFNRYIPRLATRAGHDDELVFCAQQHASHTPEVNGMRFYYDIEVPLVFAMARADGRVTARARCDLNGRRCEQGAPVALGPDPDGAHRLR